MLVQGVSQPHTLETMALIRFNACCFPRKQGPVSGWMAGTTYATAWTYAYCCYYVLRLTGNLAYIFEG